SEVYHRVSNPQFEWGKKVLARLELKGDEKVMDAGCGTGRLTAELLNRLPRGRVLAVDISRNMLQKAEEYLKPRFDGRVRYAEADLAQLPFEAECDGIFSTAAFHWVKDHDAMFRGLARALKPGGWIEAQAGGRGNLDDVHGRVLDLVERPDFAQFFENWEEPWEFPSPETTTRRMLQAGFADAEAWLEPAAVRLQGRDQYRDFLRDVILRPFLARITDEELKAKFLEEIVEQAVADPEFKLDYVRINLRGRKA
ncbi:MAG TPA: methyltransferase domain-containing protein, partial [Terriglobales bacterium]|nr:methyltransferase domain-containing protein [Terriglobales bacterium]